MVKKEIVTKIIDGDTFEINNGERIRIADMDTPEKRQPGYQKAKKALENLILDKEVRIEPVAKDKYKRTIAKVKIGKFLVKTKMKKYEKK